MIDMEAKAWFAWLFAVFAVIVLPSVYAIPVDFWGNVTINVSAVYNITPDGASITAHINGSNAINATGKVKIGVYFSGTTEASGYYLLSVNCLPGDNVSFRVYNVTALINNTWSGYPCGTAPNSTHLYLNMTARQNGSICSDNKACTTGVCGSDYDGSGAWCVPPGSCAHDGGLHASGYAGCSDTDALKTCTSGSWVTTICACSNGVCVSGGTTPAPAPTPTTETNVTNPTTIGEIIQGLKPSDLGLTTMTASDVTVKQIGSTAETTVQTTATIADLAVQMATDAAAKAAIEAVKDDVAAGNDVDVKVSLTVYKVESPSTGQSVYVSKVTLSFTAANGMKDVVIVQIIPKSIAATIANVTFLGGAPAVLQSDPIVKWSFASVSAGETKNMSYTVKKQLSGISDITTLAAAGNITAPPAVTPPTNQTTGGLPGGIDWMLVGIGIVVIILILALVYFFFVSK